jgi:hypothetical protein
MQQDQRAGQPPQGESFYCQGCLEEAYQQAGLPYTWLPSLEDEPCPRHIHDPRRRSSQQSHKSSDSQEQAPPPARSHQLAEGLSLSRDLAELLAVEARPTSPIFLAGTHPPSKPKQNPIHQAAVDFPVTGELNQALLKQPPAPTAASTTILCPRCQGSGLREIGQQQKRCWYCGGHGRLSPEAYRSEWAQGLSLEQEQALEDACDMMQDDVLRLAKELQEVEQTLQLVVGHAKMGNRKLRLIAAMQRIQGIKEELTHLADDISLGDST